jgi:argininosuccinate lyase
VRLGIESQRDLADMSLSEFKALSEVIDDDVYDVISLEGSVSARDHFGGTAPNQVKAAVERARKRLKNLPVK